MFALFHFPLKATILVYVGLSLYISIVVYHIRRLGKLSVNLILLCIIAVFFTIHGKVFGVGIQKFWLSDEEMAFSENGYKPIFFISMVLLLETEHN